MDANINPSSSASATVGTGSASTTTATIVGTIIGVALGTLAYQWWQFKQKPQDSKQSDTGEKTPDGLSIVEVLGIGGADNGVKIKGFVLPEKISDVKLPITVVVKPNNDLFLDFKAGDKVKLESRLSEELIYKGKAGGGVEGAYYIWYPELRKKVLGAIA